MAEAPKRNGWLTGFVMTALSLIVAIMLAGVPWAFTLHGKVSAIEARLDHLKNPSLWLQKQVDTNTQDINDIQKLMRSTP